jgi:hypothetical protein
MSTESFQKIFETRKTERYKRDLDSMTEFVSHPGLLDVKPNMGHVAHALGTEKLHSYLSNIQSYTSEISTVEQAKWQATVKIILEI